MAKVIDRPLAARSQRPAKKEESSDAQAWSESLQRATQPDASRDDASRVDRASAAQNRPAGSNVANDNVIEHRAKKGDSLWSISRQYDRPFPDVLKANPQFRDPDVIRPGETVRVSLGSPPPSAPPSTSTPSVPPPTAVPSTPPVTGAPSAPPAGGAPGAQPAAGSGVPCGIDASAGSACAAAATMPCGFDVGAGSACWVRTSRPARASSAAAPRAA
jgi:LysM repeat protein